MDSAHKEIAPDARMGLVSPADWEYLSLYLSEDRLRYLLGLLEQSDPPVRRALIAQTRGLAESYRDHAVFLAWARVAYTNDPDRLDVPEGGP